MWIQSQILDTSWLPLFDEPLKRKIREERALRDARDLDNLESWLNWTEGISADINTVLEEESTGIYEDINFHWRELVSQYRTEGEEFWSVLVHQVEHHGFYNIAIIEIHHRFPPKEYTAKGNKYNPKTWRYNGEPVSYSKTSPWRSEKKTYRIQYTPEKVDEKGYPIFCFWGLVRDWKQAELNINMIIPILKEIEGLA